MDPKDPDGSFDMCLTRPETMLNVCKIQLNACGISENVKEAQNSQIWDFILARLAAMRVDSCTAEVKACLQSDDRCGPDYTQCIGLDTDTIVRMCPYDKLVGCQQVYSGGGNLASGKAASGNQSLVNITSNAVYEEVARMVQGIFLNIDNNMLTECQKAADAAMVRVCGSTEDCNGLAVDDGVGSRSLEYKICLFDGTQCATECATDVTSASCTSCIGTKLPCVQDIAQVTDDNLRNTSLIIKLAGIIYWEGINFDADGNLLNTVSGDTVAVNEVNMLQKSINTAISTIEADPKVNFCITGRQVQGLGDMSNGKNLNMSATNDAVARFPSLTKQMRQIIATYALKEAKANYFAKFDELNKKMLQDYTKIGERQAALLAEDAKSVRREYARRACMGLAQGSILPKSPNPPGNALGQLIKVAAGVAMMVVPGLNVTAGIGAVGSLIGNVVHATSAVKGLIGAALPMAAKAVAASQVSHSMGDTSGAGANGQDNPAITDNGAWDVCSGKADPSTVGPGGGLMASQNMNQWNFKETITTTFNCDTMVCQRCTKSQNCDKTGDPLFGNKYCKSWAAEEQKCDDTAF